MFPLIFSQFLFIGLHVKGSSVANLVCFLKFNINFVTQKEDNRYRCDSSTFDC